jgi:importin subunit beta-1
LGNETKPIESRQVAGIILKNHLESKDARKKQQLHLQWRNLNNDFKNQVKNELLKTLHSKIKEARKISAQVLSVILPIELNENKWTDVMLSLIENIKTPSSSQGIESSLIAIGYICEECFADSLSNLSNQLLTVIIKGMREDEKDIKLAGTIALLNSLEFFVSNFDNKTERDYIMKVICETTLVKDETIKKTAIECLIKISVLYYDIIQSYMDAIYNITFKSVREDSEEIAKQSIEFWSTLAETENELIEEIEFCKESGIECKRKCFYFIKYALKPLVELLTSSLMRQNENQSEDDWNITSAAGVCLSLVCKVVGSSIINEIMTFIKPNIRSQNWRNKEAAIISVSIVVEINNFSEMNNLIEIVLPILLDGVNTKITLLKDTIIFTIGKIAQTQPFILIQKYLNETLKCLVNVLKDEPRISAKSCWAIGNIAESIMKISNDNLNNSLIDYPLNNYFGALINELLNVSNREDGSDCNLRINAFSALTSLINSSNNNLIPLLEKVTDLVLSRLETLLSKSSIISTQDKEEFNSISGSLCGSLQTLIQKNGL